MHICVYSHVHTDKFLIPNFQEDVYLRFHFEGANAVKMLLDFKSKWLRSNHFTKSNNIHV